MAEKRCYTVKELQEILGVSRPTVYNLLKKNEFRWIQQNDEKYRISKKSFYSVHLTTPADNDTWKYHSESVSKCSV